MSGPRDFGVRASESRKPGRHGAGLNCVRFGTTVVRIEGAGAFLSFLFIGLDVMKSGPEERCVPLAALLVAFVEPSEASELGICLEEGRHEFVPKNR